MSETTVANLSPAAIRAQLQRILDSPLFSSARRLSHFLQFVVGRSIEGQAGEIKEYLIAVEVYGRSSTYDPKTDSIVRAEASRLRAKLREYYDTSGRDDPVLIELPKGSYTPAFRLKSGGAVLEPSLPPEPLARRRFGWQWGVAAGVLLCAAIALVWWPLHGTRRIHSIAVMRPVNLGADRGNSALGETLADDITSVLVDSPEWKVVGRAPEVDQTGRDQMLGWLRQNLPADYVLTGGYRVGENSNVRLTLQLVDLEDGRLVWTRAYHQRLTFLAESHKELARSLVVEITEKSRNSASERKPRNPANEKARKYYAQARELWSKYTDQSLEQSLKPFQQATQADPGFAAAWAGLADANLRLVERSLEPVEVRAADARSAALKAIALDDSSAEAHAALGWLLAFKDWNFKEGSRQLERAVELDPIRVFPNIYYSQVLTMLGNFTDAQTSVEAARARLPQIPEVVFQQGSVFFLARNFEKLEGLGKELIALDPNGALGHWLVGLSLEQRSQVSGAIAEFKNGLKQSPHDLRTLCALSHSYGLAHANAKALETMRLFIDPDKKEITRWTLSYCAALTYAGMGQKEKAFEWLEKARIGRDASFPFLPYDPRFDPLKSDPKFKLLADSLKKPE